MKTVKWNGDVLLGIFWHKVYEGFLKVIFVVLMYVVRVVFAVLFCVLFVLLLFSYKHSFREF